MNEVIEPVTKAFVSIQIIVSEELIEQGCFSIPTNSPIPYKSRRLLLPYP